MTARIILILFLVSIFSIENIAAQSGQIYLTITGKVIDQKSGEAISEFHRKDRRLPVNNDRISVLENDVPFDEPIMPLESFSVSVGLMWK